MDTNKLSRVIMNRGDGMELVEQEQEMDCFCEKAELRAGNKRLREALEEAIIALKFWGLSGTDALVFKWEDLLEGSGE